MEIITYNPKLINRNDLERFNKPSCVNGVDVVKYRIKIEPIKEDSEVYRNRLRELLKSTTNPYQIQDIHQTARELNIQL